MNNIFDDKMNHGTVDQNSYRSVDLWIHVRIQYKPNLYQAIQKQANT